MWSRYRKPHGKLRAHHRAGVGWGDFNAPTALVRYDTDTTCMGQYSVWGYVHRSNDSLIFSGFLHAMQEHIHAHDGPHDNIVLSPVYFDATLVSLQLNMCNVRNRAVWYVNLQTIEQNQQPL